MPREIIHDVPIFPLNVVLFPSLPLPLHVFEERYQTMVKDLEQGDMRFIVALIRHGVEVGGFVEPWPVACLARIEHLQALDDKGYLIIAVGQERVRIVSTDYTSKPYLTGSMEAWHDEDGCATAELVQTATRLFLRYARYITKLHGEDFDENIPIPVAPDLLSYVLAAALQVEPAVRQQLLEMPGSTERLQVEVEMLQSEIPMLRALAGSPQPRDLESVKFSAN